MRKITEMTNQELRAAARNYDNAVNEGGEGFNPYRSEMEHREHKDAVVCATAYAETPQGRIDALHRRIELECGSVARECNDPAEIDALQSSLYAEIDRIQAEIDADFLAVWTLDETRSRRVTWNARVKAGEFSEIGSGKVDFRALRKAEKTQGWTLDDLKKAIKLHNL